MRSKGEMVGEYFLAVGTQLAVSAFTVANPPGNLGLRARRTRDSLGLFVS